MIDIPYLSILFGFWRRKTSNLQATPENPFGISDDLTVTSPENMMRDWDSGIHPPQMGGSIVMGGTPSHHPAIRLGLSLKSTDPASYWDTPMTMWKPTHFWPCMVHPCSSRKSTWAPWAPWAPWASAETKPSKLFMTLLDYSKDDSLDTHGTWWDTPINWISLWSDFFVFSPKTNISQSPIWV